MNKYTNEDYRIYSTEKNEMGRTAFTEYRIRSGVIKRIYPNCEFLDSQEDRENMKKTNKWLEEMQRDSRIKQYRSEHGAQNGPRLTAAA